MLVMRMIPDVFWFAGQAPAALAGLVIVFGGIRKLATITSFRDAIVRYDVSFAQHATTVAWIWASTEVAVGLAALAPFAARLLPLSLLLGVTLGLVAKRFRQGATHDCGCTSRPNVIGRGVVVRNAILVIGVVVMNLFLGGPTLALGAAVTGAVGFTMGNLVVGVSPRRKQAEEVGSVLT